MRYTTFLFAIVFSISVRASDYLAPEDSLFSRPNLSWDYYQLVVTRLKDAYTGGVIARAIVFPSFAPEYAMGIKKSSEGYNIFYLAPEKKLWGYRIMNLMKEGSIKIMKDGEFVPDDQGLKELEAEYPKNPDDIKIGRCEKKLESDLAEIILKVWEKMLLETRYIRSDDVGLDGVTYHFSMEVGFQNLSGKTRSPNPMSKSGMLVEISDLMIDFCHDKGGAKGKLEKAAKKLSAGFK